MTRESAALLWRGRQQLFEGVEVLGEPDYVGRERLWRGRQQHLSFGRWMVHRADEYVGVAHKSIWGNDMMRELEKNLLIWPLPDVERQRWPRRLKVDEVKRKQAPLKTAALQPTTTPVDVPVRKAVTDKRPVIKTGNRRAVNPAQPEPDTDPTPRPRRKP